MWRGSRPKNEQSNILFHCISKKQLFILILFSFCSHLQTKNPIDLKKTMSMALFQKLLSTNVGSLPVLDACWQQWRQEILLPSDMKNTRDRFLINTSLYLNVTWQMKTIRQQHMQKNISGANIGQILSTVSFATFQDGGLPHLLQ